MCGRMVDAVAAVVNAITPTRFSVRSKWCLNKQQPSLCNAHTKRVPRHDTISTFPFYMYTIYVSTPFNPHTRAHKQTQTHTHRPTHVFQRVSLIFRARRSLHVYVCAWKSCFFPLRDTQAEATNRMETEEIFPLLMCSITLYVSQWVDTQQKQYSGEWKFPNISNMANCLWINKVW